MPKHLHTPFQQVGVLPNPAAGAEFSIRAPGGSIWRIMSMALLFTASAAVANRRITLLADDQTDTWFAQIASADLVASSATRVGAFVGASPGGVAGSVLNLPLPQDGLILMPGYRLRSSTAGIDVADQYSAVRFWAVEYPMGPDLEWLPSIYTDTTPLE